MTLNLFLYFYKEKQSFSYSKNTDQCSEEIEINDWKTLFVTLTTESLKPKTN